MQDRASITEIKDIVQGYKNNKKELTDDNIQVVVFFRRSVK